MNRIFVFLSGLILLSLTLSSGGCRTKKVSQTIDPIGQAQPLPPKPAVKLPAYVQKIVDAQPVYDWYSAKAHVEFSQGGKDFGFTAFIRIRHDSLLWMQMLKLGFEGARMRVTPDRVMAIDRLNKQYFDKPFSYIQTAYNLPLDFRGLEAMLSGSLPPLDGYEWMPPYPDKPNIVKGISPEGTLVITTDENNLVTSLEITQAGRIVTINHSDFEDIQGRKIPFERTATISPLSDAEEGMSLTFSINKAEINEPQRTEFEIPSDYKKMVE